MMGNTVRIGRVLGIDLKLDVSWFLVFGLVTWSLAGHYFPMLHPGWPPAGYWVMGAVTATLFFASVVTHELAHSLMSRANGIPVRDITLFIFGGAAHITQEPQRARDELLMAIVGPVTSLALAAGFWLLWWLTQAADGPVHALAAGLSGVGSAVHALAGWLAGINLALGLFNLIPGFPLDGGRVFRALVWSATGDLKRATLTAAVVGRIVAFGFIFWGIAQVIGGNWANGLWIAFIGWFLDNAAAQSAQEVVVHDLLAGHKASEVMMTDCPQIPRRLTLDVLVDQLVNPNGRRCFPVVEAGALYGLVTLSAVTRVPRDRWSTTRAEEVMVPLLALKTVRPDDELADVLERMAAEDVNQLPVVEDGRLVGMVARDNLLNFLRFQLETTPGKQAA